MCRTRARPSAARLHESFVAHEQHDPNPSQLGVVVGVVGLVRLRDATLLVMLHEALGAQLLVELAVGDVAPRGLQRLEQRECRAVRVSEARQLRHAAQRERSRSGTPSPGSPPLGSASSPPAARRTRLRPRRSSATAPAASRQSTSTCTCTRRRRRRERAAWRPDAAHRCGRRAARQRPAAARSTAAPTRQAAPTGRAWACRCRRRPVGVRPQRRLLRAPAARRDALQLSSAGEPRCGCRCQSVLHTSAASIAS